MMMSLGIFVFMLSTAFIRNYNALLLGVIRVIVELAMHLLISSLVKVKIPLPFLEQFIQKLLAIKVI